MTLNHSKTWPVSTLAVVQLRVDPNGRTYSTQFDADAEADDLLTDLEVPQQENNIIKINDNPTNIELDMLLDKLPNGKSNGCVSAPATTISDKNEAEVSQFSHQHVELFSVQKERRGGGSDVTARPRHPYKTTVRTDTVSTILEQDIDNESSVISLHHEPEDKRAESRKEYYEKFHVLALAKIEECNEPDKVRTPTVRVENWDLIYSEAANNGKAKLCPACTAAAAAAINVSSPLDGNYKPKSSPNDYDDRRLVDLPLDARKATTLKRHYYPEGGWGWVIITCTVLVHVLNVGLQLSCSQLAPSGAEKFKTTQVHIAGQWLS